MLIDSRVVAVTCKSVKFMHDNGFKGARGRILNHALKFSAVIVRGAFRFVNIKMGDGVSLLLTPLGNSLSLSLDRIAVPLSLGRITTVSNDNHHASSSSTVSSASSTCSSIFSTRESHDACFDFAMLSAFAFAGK